MRRILFTTAVVCLALTLSTGCIFKQQPFKGVVGYDRGKVYLTPNRYYGPGIFYRVGRLPEGWVPIRTGARTITFYNDVYRSSISTDAWCGRSIGDRSLVSLTGDIVTALEHRSFSEEKNFMLDGRGALRQMVMGKVDGVPTTVDFVVVRKGGCVFDFYLVASGEPPVEATEDFEAFFGGFRFADQ